MERGLDYWIECNICFPRGGEDAIGIGGPDEGLGVGVGFLAEAVDGGREVADGPPRELGEEALDSVEP